MNEQNNKLTHACIHVCLPGADTCMYACLELTASSCILFKTAANLSAWDSGHYTLNERLAVQHSRRDTDLKVHGQLFEGVLVLHSLQHLHSSLHVPLMQHAPMIILQLSMILPIQPMTSYPLWSLQMHAAAGVLKAGTPSGKQPKLPCGLCARLDSKL